MKEYVVIGPNAWGSSQSEDYAVARMATQIPFDHLEDGDVDVLIYGIEGDWEINGMTGFRADGEDLRSFVRISVPLQDLLDIKERAMAMESMVENILVEGGTVEDVFVGEGENLWEVIEQ